MEGEQETKREREVKERWKERKSPFMTNRSWMLIKLISSPFGYTLCCSALFKLGHQSVTHSRSRAHTRAQNRILYLNHLNFPWLPKYFNGPGLGDFYLSLPLFLTFLSVWLHSLSRNTFLGPKHQALWFGPFPPNNTYSLCVSLPLVL